MAMAVGSWTCVAPPPAHGALFMEPEQAGRAALAHPRKKPVAVDDEVAESWTKRMLNVDCSTANRVSL